MPRCHTARSLPVLMAARRSGARRHNACPPDRRPPRGVSGRKAEAELAELMKALAHPARVHIVRVLLAKESCVAGELASEVPLAASTVSRHLRVLKEAGLVKGEVDGPHRCYCIDRTALDRLRQLLEHL